MASLKEMGWCRRLTGRNWILQAVLTAAWIGFECEGIGANPEPPGSPLPLLTDLAQTHQAGAGLEWTNVALSIEAVVQGVFPKMSLAVLRDRSGAAAVQADLDRFPLEPGQRVKLTGHGQLRQGQISLLPPLLADNDGLHNAREVTGRVWMSQGMHAIEVDYFQRSGPSSLAVTWEPAGGRPERLPPEALFHATNAPGGAISYAPGLAYEYFEGALGELPDFSRLEQRGTGMIEAFVLPQLSRKEDYALRIKGFVQAPEPGVYVFHLSSDDGSRLYVQGVEPQVQVLKAAEPLRLGEPRPISIGQPLSESDEYGWTMLRGTVTFATHSARGWELEISSESGRARLCIDGTEALPLESLRNQRIQARGFCQHALNTEGNRVAARLLVPSAAEIATEEGFLRGATGSAQGILPLVTSASQVRQMKASEAARAYPVRLRGVITDRHSPGGGVIQDATSGVYVEFDPALTSQLPVGSYCEVEGVTAPGGFAPIVLVRKAARLGDGQFPAPLHPDYAQLIGGSMDCQWVEVEGVLSEVLPLGDLRIAIKGGRVGVTIIDHSNIELINGLSNATVRVRGCAIPKWNEARQVVGTAFIRVPSVSFIDLEQPPPATPFASFKEVAELSQFDPGMNGVRRVAVRGQISYATESVAFLLQTTNGLRLVPRDTPQLRPGDLVEVAGLQELDGSEPLLREAVIRVTGHALLPPPPRCELSQVLRGDLHAAWVEVGGRLVSCRPSHTGPILELESQMRSLEIYCRTNVSMASLPPPGSELAIRGVVARRERTEARAAESSILLVSSPQDIQCLRLPPRWNLRHALLLIAVLTLGMILAGLWIRLLRRTVEQRTLALRTEMEERRGAEARLRTLEVQGALEAQRTRIARNIHDDLGARATRMTRLAQRARALGPDAAVHLDDLCHTSRQMVEALDETVWTVDSSNDSLARLVDYIVNFVQDFFRGTDVRCHLDIPLDLPDQPLTAEFRYSLFLLVKEALNNALKHSQARMVLLKMGLAKGCLEIVIRDDGCGLPPSAFSAGHGLNGMQQRAESLGGKLALDSSPGGGTQVRVTVPLIDRRTESNV